MGVDAIAVAPEGVAVVPGLEMGGCALMVTSVEVETKTVLSEEKDPVDTLAEAQRDLVVA